MKRTKRLFFITCLLVFMLSLTACSQGNQDGKGKNELPKNVVHESLSVTSTVNGNTVSAQSLTFNPADGYIPVVFEANAGWASLLEDHYKTATGERYGYDVVGIINGSFFSMDTGTLNGNTITDGRITCAHDGFTGEMVTFGADGAMRIVNSALEYKVSINGQNYDSALYYINKVSPAGSVNDKLYYWDSACGAKSDATEAGYELLFNKKDNTELSVGKTLVGELVSVTETTEETKGIEIGSNQFVLYCKTASPFAQNLKSLTPGSQVRIDVNETIEESREVMENCSSAITNVGWLVKDGVDQTEINKTIGTHSVDLEARWTAFGTKEDGSYVFFTSEGASTGEEGSITLRDVAKTMMDMGCTNVIRMDGGGSSAMYLCDAGEGKPGFVQVSERAVSDCIMVVKRDSMAPSKELKSDLEAAISTAKNLYDQTKSEEIKVAYDYASAIAESATATEGEYKKACMKIANAIYYIEDLKALISAAEMEDSSIYSDYAYIELTTAIANAKTKLDNNASKEELVTCYNDLLHWYTLTGAIDVNVATGKPYTTNIPFNANYADTDNKELTDGLLGDASNTYSPTWIGFNEFSADASESLDVIVDLGETMSGLRNFTVNAHHQPSWGIVLPAKVTVYVSDDGKSWKEVAATTVATESIESINPAAVNIVATAAEDVSARYVKYSITPYGEFIFISEVTAEVHYE